MLGRLFSSCGSKAGWLILGCIPLLLGLLDEVLLLCDQLSGSRSEMEQIKADLERARRRIKELETRLNQNSSNSSKPPSSDDAKGRAKRSRKNRRKGRKPGGQPGHRGRWRRLLPPKLVDFFEDIFPSQCSRCGARLPRPPVMGRVRRWQQHEWMGPSTGVRVTEFRCHAVRCAACNKKTFGELPARARLSVGPRLQAVVVILTVTMRLSRGQVRNLLGQLLGVRISVGTLQALCMRASRALEDPYQCLAEEIRQTYAPNMDETSWKKAAKRLWLWVARTNETTLYRIAESRGGEVVREILGEDFDGTVMCDRWSAYKILGKLAYCWAHLKRNFQSMVDRDDGAKEIGESLLKLTKELFKAWHRFVDEELTRAELVEQTAGLREEFRVLFEEATRSSDEKAQGLGKNLLKNWAHLFRFLDEEGIEPTNNAAERALRALVILRRLSYGSRSDDGCRFIERAFSVVQTLLDRDVDVLEWLGEAFLRERCGEPVPDIGRTRSSGEEPAAVEDETPDEKEVDGGEQQQEACESTEKKEEEARPLLDWSRHSLDLSGMEFATGVAVTEGGDPQGSPPKDGVAGAVEASTVDCVTVGEDDVSVASEPDTNAHGSDCAAEQDGRPVSREAVGLGAQDIEDASPLVTFDSAPEERSLHALVLSSGDASLAGQEGASSPCSEGAKEQLWLSVTAGGAKNHKECVGTTPAPG